jgi:hypothetical protein
MWEPLPNDQVELVNVDKHLHPLSMRQNVTWVESESEIWLVELEMVHSRYMPELGPLRILVAELRD